MTFCNQCGTEIPDGAKFCANCGAAVAGRASAIDTGGIDVSRGAASPRDGVAHSGGSEPVASSSGIRGWILPALVAVAALLIGYLLLVPKDAPPAAGTRETAAAGQGGEPRPQAVGEDRASTRPEDERDAATLDERRAVDAASDAASIASANMRGRNSVSATVLDAAFSSDPASAALRYAGPIRVSGTIATMVQPGPTPALSLEGRTRFNFMIVQFPEGYRARLAPLAKGQSVSVVCDQVRALGGTTILSGCLLD